MGVVLRLQVDAHNVDDACPRRTNASRRAAPDVEDLAGGLLRGCMTREQIRVHDIRHERKVTRLPAVSEDDGRLAAERGSDEQRDDGAVLRVQALTRSEGSEVPEQARLEPVD